MTAGSPAFFAKRGKCLQGDFVTFQPRNASQAHLLACKQRLEEGLFDFCSIAAKFGEFLSASIQSEPAA